MLFHKEGSDGGVFWWKGVGSQIPQQKSWSVRQRALESICAELNRPAGKGIL